MTSTPIGAKSVTLVDVNPDNIRYCSEHLRPLGFEIIQNNGFDLNGLASGAFSHIHCFDAMVHFEVEIIMSYLAEFARVLISGGTALLHHSNYTDRPGADFRTNPGWRNFCSAGLMRHMALRNSFEVIDQKVIAWGLPELDCITLLRRT